MTLPASALEPPTTPATPSAETPAVPPDTPVGAVIHDMGVVPTALPALIDPNTDTGMATETPTPAAAASNAANSPASHQTDRLSGMAIIVALACSVFWGGNSVAVKAGSAEIPTALMGALRFGLGMMITGGYAFVLGKWALTTRDQFRLIWINGVLLYFQIYLFNLGTQWSSGIHSSVLINTYPFFTVLLTIWLLPNQPVARQVWQGITIAFSGVLVMFGEQFWMQASQQSSYLLGDFLLLLSAAVLGWKTLWIKRALLHMHIVQLIFWEAALVVPLFLMTSLATESIPTHWPTATIVAICYQGWFVSGMTFLIWFGLLRYYGAAQLSILSFTTPVFGSLLSIIILNELVSRQLVFGVGLIALGIYWSNRRPKVAVRH